MNGELKRYEVWAYQYQADRYMAHVTVEELKQRAADVVSNMTYLTDENKIAPLLPKGETEKWIILWTHVVMEMQIRFGPYPAGFDGIPDKMLQFPDPRRELADQAAKLVCGTRSRCTQPFLVKYGKGKFLIPLLKEGVMRVLPASQYRDASLNPAIQDDELNLTLQPPTNRFKMHVLRKNGRPKTELRPIDNKISLGCPTDYYVCCLSSSLGPRLFGDFDADACIVITKPTLFVDRFLVAFDEVISGVGAAARPVQYVDPLLTPVNSVGVHFFKHFRYEYQHEFRIVVTPPSPPRYAQAYLSADGLFGRLR